jgi:GH18 family chitinase
MIPSDLLTHINYAFANVNASTGEVFLSDTWADVEVNFSSHLACFAVRQTTSGR